MIDDEKKIFEGEYEEKPIEKPKPIPKPKVEVKEKPPVVEKVSKVNLKDTIKLCDKLYTLVFTMSGNHRWSEARQTLADIKKDVEDKLKE